MRGEGWRHTAETKAKIGVALRGNTNCFGRKHSLETRMKISAAGMGNTRTLGHRWTARTRVKLAEAAARQEPTWGPTGIHYDLAGFLADAGLRVALEVPFGRARVDIYLLDCHLAVEADGDYHHALTERDRPGYYARRDAELLRRFGLPVARFTEVEITELAA